MNEEKIPEVEVTIQPRVKRLEELGISMKEFETAVSQSLDQYHDLFEGKTHPDGAPKIDAIKVQIGEKVFLLGDIAEINISGDLG